MARPRSPLPDDQIAYLGRQGMGAPAILEVIRRGHPQARERTVGDRLSELRAGGWPGADDYAASLAAGKGPPGPADTTRPPTSAGPDALTEADLERLPAELLATAARETARALRRALDDREVVSVDKLASVLERFSRRLVEVRPPERVEPVKDPTNLAARREILARWERLREPYEVALPVVEAIEAHAARLRARMEAGAPAPA